MPYQSKRNESATPLLQDLIGCNHEDSKDVRYINSTGFTKREEAALRIYCELMQAGMSGNIGPEYAKHLASTSIDLADKFFDELERPERERLQKLEVEIKVEKERDDALKESMWQACRKGDREFTDEQIVRLSQNMTYFPNTFLMALEKGNVPRDEFDNWWRNSQEY